MMIATMTTIRRRLLILLPTTYLYLYSLLHHGTSFIGIESLYFFLSPTSHALILRSLSLSLRSRCGPCRLTTPILKEIITSKQYNSKVVTSVEVCTDEFPQIANELCDVTSIPTIQFYTPSGKHMVEQQIVGCVAKSILEETIDRVLNLQGTAIDDGSSRDIEDEVVEKV